MVSRTRPAPSQHGSGRRTKNLPRNQFLIFLKFLVDLTKIFFAFCPAYYALHWLADRVHPRNRSDHQEIRSNHHHYLTFWNATIINIAKPNTLRIQILIHSTCSKVDQNAINWSLILFCNILFLKCLNWLPWYFGQDITVKIR